jgi:hypothetical protein
MPPHYHMRHFSHLTFSPSVSIHLVLLTNLVARESSLWNVTVGGVVPPFNPWYLGAIGVVYACWGVPHQSPMVMKVVEESVQVCCKRLKINATLHSVQKLFGTSRMDRPECS